MDLKLVGAIASRVGGSALSKAGEAVESLVKKKDDGEEAAPLRDASTAADSSQAWGDAAPSDIEPEELKDARDNLITPIEFRRLTERLAREPSTAATSESLARRFSVKLRNFVLENTTEIEGVAAPVVFFIISVGGTVMEIRVKEESSKKSVPRTAGFQGKVFITPMVTATAKIPAEMQFQQSFEWRGSYTGLERELFRLELWQNGGIMLNKLLAQYEEPLRALVDASVARTTILETDDKRQFRLSYMMEFQEIFDFPLNFCNVRLVPFVGEAGMVATKTTEQCKDENLKKSGDNVNALHRLFENYEGAPKLRLLIKSSGYNKWPLKLTSAPCDPRDSFSWDYLGRLTFRGTKGDLDMAEVHVIVRDSIQPSKRSKSSLKGSFSLRDITDAPNFAFPVSSNEASDSVATVVGLCGVPFKPKYRQCGQILDIDERNLYLFVKLLRIDRLRPQIPAEEMDCYAEAEFEGDTKQTATIHGTMSPQFQSELVYSIKVRDVENITAEEIEAKGPVRVDIWGSTGLGQQHLGWAEIYIAEMLKTDGSEEALRPQSKRYFDRKKNKEIAYETRVSSLQKKLLLPWDSSKDFASSLYIETWTKPDIGALRLITPPKIKRFTLPPELVQIITPLSDGWDKIVKPLSHSGRQFGFLATDQRARLIPFNFFITPIHPPPEISSPDDCLNFVRCIAFTDVGNAPFNWCSYDFTCKVKSGTVFHHALLLCCLLNGLKVPSFVCIGTRHDDEPYAWVLSVDLKHKSLNPTLSFWDIPENIIYRLPPNVGGQGLSSKMNIADGEILSDWFQEKTGKLGILGKVKVDLNTALKSGVVPIKTTSQNPLGSHTTARRIRKGLAQCPFKTIDVIFNHTGIFANLQTVPSIESIRYDIYNNLLWKSFYVHVPDLEHLFARSPLGAAPDEKAARQIANSLYDGISRGIQSYRLQMSKTAGTSWVRQQSLTSFLEKGMQLLTEIEKWDINSSRGLNAKSHFDEWRMILFSITPKLHKMRWIHLSFNHSNIKIISQQIWSSVKFLTENDPSMLLSLGIYVRPMPADLVMTYIIIVAITQIRRAEQKEMGLEVSKQIKF